MDGLDEGMRVFVRVMARAIPLCLHLVWSRFGLYTIYYFQLLNNVLLEKEHQQSTRVVVQRTGLLYHSSLFLSNCQGRRMIRSRAPPWTNDHRRVLLPLGLLF